MSAVLPELHPDLEQHARDAAAMAGLSQVEVHTVDAGRAEAYRVVVSADIVFSWSASSAVSPTPMLGA